ncbi:MAG: hypothetical protein V1792_14640 [Pseudomonadota bacterium]
MTETKYSIAYIDESPEELNRYQELLQSSNLVTVNPVEPSPNVIDTMSGLDASLILIDYVLDEDWKGRPRLEYRGGLLAAAARQKYPETPIVLLTKQKFVKTELPQAEALASAYDEKLVKSDITDDSSHVVRMLINLIDGFERLSKSAKKDWDGLLAALDATGREDELLRSAQPPITKEGEWRVPEAAGWIREVLVKYPGILYDRLHAATALGIEEAAFQSRHVQEYFEESRYAGAFASDDELRWWKMRLLVRANEALVNAEMAGDPAAKFSDAWKTLKSEALQPSKCVFSGEEHADCVCFVLRRPVMRQYSLPIIPDNRPSVMDTARVSFKAVLEENFDERWIREDARRSLKRIRKAKGDS